MKHVAIIGAGYAGVALANLLARSGIKVDVFEKNATPGGRIAVIKKDGFTFDIGPSWYLMPEVFEHYYSLFEKHAATRLGLVRLSPGYQVFFDHAAPITIQGSLKDDARTFEQIEPGAGKRLTTYVKKAMHTYEIARQQFLYNNFAHANELLNIGVLRSAPHIMSLAVKSLDRHVQQSFHDSRLQRILEYHSVFLGSSPYSAPAIYRLMSSFDFTSGVYYPGRGMYSLVEDLMKLDTTKRITYHYNAAVTRIDTEGRQATGVTLSDGTTHTASIVVSAADLHFTETKLLPEALQTYPERYWARREPGPSGLVILLGIKGTLPQLLHHNLYFVDDWKENFTAIYDAKAVPEHPSMYICNPSKTDPSLAPSGTENLFILVPFPAGRTLSAEETEKLAETYIRTLGRIIGEPNLANRILTQEVIGAADFMERYNAWAGNAFGGESHILRQSAPLRTKNKSRRLDNLYYTGAGTLPGIGLPMCLISAELTYKRIMGIKGGGPLGSIF